MSGTTRPRAELRAANDVEHFTRRGHEAEWVDMADGSRRCRECRRIANRRLWARDHPAERRSRDRSQLDGHVSSIATKHARQRSLSVYEATTHAVGFEFAPYAAGPDAEDYQHGVDGLLIGKHASNEREAIEMMIREGTMPVELGRQWIARLT